MRRFTLFALLFKKRNTLFFLFITILFSQALSVSAASSEWGSTPTIYWDVTGVSTCQAATTYPASADGNRTLWRDTNNYGQGVGVYPGSGNLTLNALTAAPGTYNFSCTDLLSGASGSEDLTITCTGPKVWNGTTCAAPASPCTTQTLSWGAGSACSASVTGVASGGTSVGTDSSTPNTGSATFSCSNTVWTVQGGSTCTLQATASYTISAAGYGTNVHSISYPAGVSNTKTWSSTNGTSWFDEAQRTGSCVNNSWGDTSWSTVGITSGSPSGGSNSSGVSNQNDVGCTVNLRYTAQSAGGNATDNVDVTVTRCLDGNYWYGYGAGNGCKVCGGAGCTGTGGSPGSPSGGLSCSNGGTVPTCADACGSQAGLIQNPDVEPTGAQACAAGTLNSSSPANTTAAWNWTCGSLSCSAPKWGCNISTDTNYDPSGAANGWKCASTCANGSSNYPTCTPRPTISSFTASPNSVTSGGASTLSWGTSGASSCSIDQGIGSVSTNSSTGTGALFSNTTYTLTCSNAGGSVQANVTVTVSGMPDSCGAWAGATPRNPEPTGGNACGSGTLNSSSPVDTGTTWNWTCGSLACSAPKYGCSITTDTNYNPSNTANDWGCASTCANTSGNYPTCTPKPTISSFTNNGPITYNTSATLSWGTSGASSCSISNGIGSVAVNSSTPTPNLTVNTPYTLTCSNAGGSATANTTVNISGAPAANFTGEPFSCNVPSNGSSCNPTVSWTASNAAEVWLTDSGNGIYSGPNGNGSWPVGAQSSSVYSNYGGGFYKIQVGGSNNSGLLVGGTDLDSTTTTAPCTGGTSWDGSKCAPSSTPDLTTDSTTPSSANSGVSTTLGTTIRNIGTLGTGAGFQMFFQVATASNGGGTVSDLGANGVGALCSGCSVGTTKNYVFPSAGTYSVRACSDKASSASSGVISEGDEGNNCSNWTNVTVTSAAVSVSISPSTSQTINLGDILAFSSTANYPSSDLTRHSIFWQHNGVWNWYPYTELDGQPAAAATKFWDYAGASLSTHTINVKPLESGSYTILWAGRNDGATWPSDGPHCGDAGITCSTSVSVTVNAATSLSGNNCTISAYSSTCRGTPFTVNNPVFAFYDLVNETTGITTSNSFFAGNGYTYNPGWDGTAASIREGTNILRLRQGGMGTNLATLFAVGTCAGGSTWNGATGICEGNGPAVPAIDGPISGVPGTSYTFGFQADDPNNWSVSYLIDWDNNGIIDTGAGDEILGSAPHNTRLTTTHSWGTVGAKTFRVKTRNFLTEESGWATWTTTIVNQPVADFTLSPNPVKTGNLYNLDLTPSTNALRCKVERKTDAAPSYTTALPCWSAASNMTPFDRAVTNDGLTIGTNQYRVTCYSDAACTQNASVPVVKNLIITPPNTDPVISISPNTAVSREPGQSVTFSSVLTDVDDNITEHKIDWLNVGTGEWSYAVGVANVTGVAYSALTNLTNIIGSFAIPTGSNTGSVTLTFDRPGTYQVQAAAYDVAWNFAVPATVTINVACPATKTWDPLSGTCQLPSGTLNATPNACLINTLASTCPVTLDWTTSFPIGISSITRDGTPGDLYTGNNNPGQLENVPYESDGLVTYREYNNGNPTAMTTVAVSCKPGEGWDNIGGVCADPRVTSKDVAGEYYPPGKISFTCSNSSNAWEVQGGVVAPSTGVYVFPQTIEVEPTVSGTYTITCKHGDYEGPDETVYYNSSPPPAPKISFNISPRSVAKGEKITLSWDVQFPIGACKLEAKAVCANGICSPTQIATESSFNLKLINETTNADDPYGPSRPIPAAVNTFATGHTPTDHPTDWKALGRKTFTIGSTMDFSLDCGAGNQETKRAQVIKTEEQ